MFLYNIMCRVRSAHARLSVNFGALNAVRKSNTGAIVEFDSYIYHL